MSKVAISPVVASILGRSSVDGNVVRLPAGQLDKTLYASVDKTLKALGGKWDRRVGGHVFPRDIGDDLAAALSNGHAVDQKKANEQFFTPRGLAARMASMIECRGRHVLEPSCGSGVLVHAAFSEGAEVVTAVEIDEGLSFDVACEFHDAHVFNADCMSWTPASPVPIDAVIMNPPFSRNQDIAHVRRAFSFLKPGGRLAAIMSTHWTFADDQPSREFRAFIGFPQIRGHTPADVVCEAPDPSVENASFERLPEAAFKASGTMVATCLVIIRKAA